MQKANLVEGKKRSFIELSSQETDDYVDDDEEIASKKKSNLKKESEKSKSFVQKPHIEEENNEMSLLEKNMESEMDNKKSIRDLVYNKPNENRNDLEMQRAQIFRNTQMANLQTSHTFRQASRENINEAYNKGSASLGKQNADEFVSFLGYLRDSSSRASQLIAKKQEQKLAKLIKGDGEDKKSGLTVGAPKTADVDTSNKTNADEAKKNDYVPTSSTKYSSDQ